MSSYICPFCNHTFKIEASTYYESGAYFSYRDPADNFHCDSKYELTIHFYKCPNCEIISSTLEYAGSELPDRTINIYPVSNAKQYPSYVPKPICTDYEEAYSILKLSPKSSATLSRRCIQGMIHDKWDIKLKNLNQEITYLKDKIDPTLWAAIDALRQLGNIGAHMEKDINTIVDIDSDEAEKLINLVEILIKEWYIIPHEREELLTGIALINAEKQNQRKKTE